MLPVILQLLRLLFFFVFYYIKIPGYSWNFHLVAARYFYLTNPEDPAHPEMLFHRYKARWKPMQRAPNRASVCKEVGVRRVGPHTVISRQSHTQWGLQQLEPLWKQGKLNRFQQHHIITLNLFSSDNFTPPLTHTNTHTHTHTHTHLNSYVKTLILFIFFSSASDGKRNCCVTWLHSASRKLY